MSPMTVRHNLGPGYTVYLPSGKAVRFPPDSAVLEVAADLGEELVRSGVCSAVRAAPEPKASKSREAKPKKKRNVKTTAAESSD